MDPGKHAPSRAAGLLAALALVASPVGAHAAPAPGAPAEPAPASAAEPAQPAVEKDPPSTEPAPLTAPPPTQPVEMVAPPNNVSQSAGVGGRAVSTDDPEGRRARAELEGKSLGGTPADGVPDRLPPLQRGGWWSVFAAFALASTGGVFAGLAEAEEDRLTRLVATIDPDTGAQQAFTGQVQEDYDAALARGRRDAILARTFLAAGGAALVVGIGLFIADRVKRRSSRVRAGAGGLVVRF